MPNNPSSLRVRLFYSYSHTDTKHRIAMEKALASLKRHDFLADWSDAKILPGQSIAKALHAKLSNSDIIAFLLSPDFLNSEECLKEWNHAKQLASSGRPVFRVPIIVRVCAWKDFLDDDDIKALPTDGKAITAYGNSDTAWYTVYEGIKSIVERLRTTYTAKPTFLEDLNSTDLPTTPPISLDELFVFPRLTKHDSTDATERLPVSTISSVDDLRHQDHSIIHGPEQSGKTALARRFVLSLINDEQPVLFVDLGTATGHLNDNFLRARYEEQFDGDYYLWQQQESKTLIIDNMTEAPKLLKFIKRYSETFSHICLFVSSDIFRSYLLDDKRLVDFQEIRLEPLTRTKQEQLIRNRLTTMQGADTLTDGLVDQVEDRVNSIIISNMIVPRYPFFVLAILQTYDALMPRSLPITSYGHCYYVFIVASLRRAGISDTDDAINSSFNFAEQLALATFRARREAVRTPLDFPAFLRRYRDDYFIEASLVNRLTHKDYGIITGDGKFTTAYMYYFFLGRLLATNSELAEEYLPELCAHSYEEGIYLTLLFTIHHATDDKLIEDIQIRTMMELDHLAIATLREEETSRFASIVSELPESVLSGDSIEKARAEERQAIDNLEEGQGNESDRPEDEGAEHVSASMLRVFKNNKILGQVLRNQYGKLPKGDIEEIIETIADSSFRIVNLLLKDEDEIRDLALYIKAKWPEAELPHVQQMLTYFSFVWTMMNIEQAVQAVCVPSIREAVDAVVARNDSPAYEIFGYFYKLDCAQALTRRERNILAKLYRNHRDQFIKRVLSLRTQFYMNTHRSKMSVEQSICAVLGIRYRARPR